MLTNKSLAKDACASTFWLHALPRTFTLNVLDIIPPARQAGISKGGFETEEISIRTLLTAESQRADRQNAL